MIIKAENFFFFFWNDVTINFSIPFWLKPFLSINKNHLRSRSLMKASMQLGLFNLLWYGPHIILRIPLIVKFQVGLAILRKALKYDSTILNLREAIKGLVYNAVIYFSFVILN